jgi:hypothetical protein
MVNESKKKFLEDQFIPLRKENYSFGSGPVG